MKIIDKLLPVSELGFGIHFCPVALQAQYSKGRWGSLQIKNSNDFEISPAAKVFHYAQEVFEGLKAFRRKDGGVHLFRPQDNVRRMTRSAKMIAMPPFPEQEFLEGMKNLVAELRDFVPDAPGALYLRPTLIGNSPSLGVTPAQDYLFFILASPVGGYFGPLPPESPGEVSIEVSEKYVRAVRGGVGSAKTGGNYAASLRAVEESKINGYNNVLFLDALERRYIEELGGMNFFLVDDGCLKTPSLGDTILAGITRDSVVLLARKLGLQVTEEKLDIQEVIEKCRSGEVTETFACGTAASITAITELGWRGERVAVGGKRVGETTQQLFSELSGIQYGTRPAPVSDWLVDC